MQIRIPSFLNFGQGISENALYTFTGKLKQPNVPYED
jgi:hypothetical protein